jgi:signal transduction histidine kinase
VSVLGSLTSAWVKQRPRAFRAAVWVLAVAGPVLLALAAFALHLALLQGAFLVIALILVTALAIAGGVWPALAALLLSIVARMFFFQPPFMISLIGFAIAGLAISLLMAKVGQLAAQQAALRRVATLVAHTVPANELFAAAAREAGRLVGADYVSMSRNESGVLVTIAAWDRSAERGHAGGPSSLIRGLVGALFRTGRPGQIEDIAAAYQSLAEDAGAHRLRAVVAVPIIVGGRSRGAVLIGSTVRWALPAYTERRMAGFADLLGAAISNAENRAGLTCLADEQAALRRVATLVAREAPPEKVFTAVTEEAGHLLQAEITSMLRYESDGTSTIVASWGKGARASLPVGDRQPLDGRNLAAMISETSRPARLDHYDDISGVRVKRLTAAGFRSGVGAPIIVDGRLWGAVLAATTDVHVLSSSAESRIGSFTDLVATAVSNAENRAELMASRARVLAAADEARRQIERDLHDGAQQRLVSLTLALRAAQTAVPPNSGQLGEDLGSVAEGLNSVLDDLRELARGIHPSILSAGGLVPALKTLARRSIVPVELNLHQVARLPEQVEVAAYYVVSEALANAAKHSGASVVQIGTDIESNVLHLHVVDDGHGGADPALGSGLVGLMDRVEALGGKVAVRSPAGAGTSLDAELPLAA